MLKYRDKSDPYEPYPIMGEKQKFLVPNSSKGK